MIITKPEVHPEGLYTQAQVARILKINRHTVARYEVDGCLKFRVRRAGKTKVTTGKEIIKCWLQMC